jgi:hypothetical protein
MKKFCFLLLISVSTIVGSNAVAQQCLDYAPADKAYVKAIFNQVTPVINRLHELAVQSNEFKLNPQTQRAAMNGEFQYLANYLTQLGDSSHPVKKKTKIFLNTTIDRTYLGLNGTTVDATTVAEAEAKTYEAIRKTFSAVAQLWGCY